MTLFVHENTLFTGVGERGGQVWMKLKEVLVNSGYWVVTGSGDGFSMFQNEGQTAGVGGSYDVLTVAPVPNDSNWHTGTPGSISNLSAWFQLKEVATTRVMQFWRDNSASYTYGDGMAIRMCSGGVAVTGATANTAPAPVGVSYNLAGNLATKTTIQIANGQNGPLYPITNPDVGLQIWYGPPRAEGVCPFAWLIFNNTNNSLQSGMFYESLVDFPEGAVEPWIASVGVIWHSFGTVGNTVDGPFNKTTFRINGINGKAWVFDATMCEGTRSPGNVYAPVVNGKWKTKRCLARTTAAPNLEYIGTSEHFLQNLVARDYPATYDLTLASPRIAVGQLLLPWKQAVIPVWGP
jgi:hypothetical protein